MGIQMYPDRTSVIVRSLVSWPLIGLCAGLAWVSLSTAKSHYQGSTGYACGAAILGAIALLRHENPVPAYMVVIIGFLDLATASNDSTSPGSSILMALLGALVGLAFLLAAIWGPIRSNTPESPPASQRRRETTRAIAATSLSFFVPLVSSIVPAILNRAPRPGTSTTLLHWNAYMFALFFTCLSYILGAVVVALPPSSIAPKHFLRPYVLPLFAGTSLASIYFESLARRNWTALVLSEIGVAGAFVVMCHTWSKNVSRVRVPGVTVEN